MNSSIWRELKAKFFESGSPAMLYIGINVIVFVGFGLANVIFSFSGNVGMVNSFITEYFAFPEDFSRLGTRFYTVLTYQFFHDGLFHILFNMLWLYWMGQLFLDFLKPRQFHFVYLGGGVLGALIFLLLYNIIPTFANHSGILIGASASVMAIVVATGTLLPDYSLRLMFFGDVKLKYLVLAYVVIDVLGAVGKNAGGSMAHLGGALFGFIFIKSLQNGKDWSTIFKRKPKLKVVKNDGPKNQNSNINQKEIDVILDKISKSGYDKLSKDEKETLFKASKN
ncbi:MAG: rhomboid family intramembrane serine protease [Pedobacter sp.]|nr:MAG: rhomboid family intramembrane serine protease [Pedobacter sp.]